MTQLNRSLIKHRMYILRGKKVLFYSWKEINFIFTKTYYRGYLLLLNKFLFRLLFFGGRGIAGNVQGLLLTLLAGINTIRILGIIGNNHHEHRASLVLSAAWYGPQTKANIIKAY